MIHLIHASLEALMFRSLVTYFHDLIFGGTTVLSDPTPTTPSTTPPAALPPTQPQIFTVIDTVLTELAAELPIGRGHYACLAVQTLLELELNKIWPKAQAKLAAKGITV